MADLLGIFGNIGSGLLSNLYYILALIPIAIIVILIVSKIRVKMIYKHPIRVYRVRENGKVKESNFIGGYIGRRNSAPFFRMKTGKWWWQYVDLTKTPNPAYMDEDDRIYYKQIDVGSYLQMRRDFPINPGDKVKYTPVEPDIKYGAILSIQKIKEVLRLEPTWKKVLPYIGLGIVGIILIIGYAILLKTKCPV